MEKDKKFEKIIESIPTPVADQEFRQNLSDELAIKAENISSKRNRKKEHRSILLPWQLGLAFTSFVFIILITLTILTSQETKQRMIKYIKQEAKSAFSEVTIVTIPNTDKDEVNIFVYNLLEEDKPPLDVSLIQKGDDVEILLYPGYYKIIFIKEGEPVIEKNIVIEDDEKEVTLNLENLKEDE
ncbi:hypothetical protein GF362_06305 [Candidatus Dojkabacteria bacterium]|nr:hypothetical protein [Candidatus Dojkabacteria bacterium]